MILSNKLRAEIEEQATKTKFAKYFTAEQASLLLELLAEVGTIHADNDLKQTISRDPDDDYLLALARTAKANVLLTGDEDLLVLEKHGRTRIMNANAFVEEYLGGRVPERRVAHAYGRQARSSGDPEEAPKRQ